MASIIILDMTLTATFLVLLVRSVWFQVSHHKRLKAYGADVGALITHVRRDNITHQACQITANWTDPRTGHRLTFRGLRFDMGYQPGQLIGIRLDPKHLSDEGKGLLLLLPQMSGVREKQPSEVTRSHVFCHRGGLTLGLGKAPRLPSFLKLDPALDHHPAPGKATCLQLVPQLTRRVAPLLPPFL